MNRRATKVVFMTEMLEYIFHFAKINNISFFASSCNIALKKMCRKNEGCENVRAEKATHFLFNFCTKTQLLDKNDQSIVCMFTRSSAEIILFVDIFLRKRTKYWRNKLLSLRRNCMRNISPKRREKFLHKTERRFLRLRFLTFFCCSFSNSEIEHLVGPSDFAWNWERISFLIDQRETKSRNRNEWNRKCSCKCVANLKFKIDRRWSMANKSKKNGLYWSA